MTSQTKHFAVYTWGLVHLSCCTDVTDRAEIERLANIDQPTGIASKWTIADEPFASGQPNGCPCNDEPDKYHHWLLSC